MPHARLEGNTVKTYIGKLSLRGEIWGPGSLGREKSRARRLTQPNMKTMDEYQLLGTLVSLKAPRLDRGLIR